MAANGDLASTAEPAQTKTCSFTNKFDPLGNALEFPMEDIELVTTDSTTNYEYVIEVSSIGNPFDAHPRNDSGLDLNYKDPDRDSFADDVKFESYEKYTSKFELAVYSTKGEAAYTSRAYGMLSNSYLGFSAKSKKMYVVDEDEKWVTELNPLIVGNGQQSKNYFIITDEDFTKAANNPVILDSVTLSAVQSWVELGYNNEDATISKGGYDTYFRVTAG